MPLATSRCSRRRGHLSQTVHGGVSDGLPMQSATPVKCAFNSLANLSLRLYKGLASHSCSKPQCTRPTWGKRHAQKILVKIGVSQVAVARGFRQRQGFLLYLGTAIPVVANCIPHIPGRFHAMVASASRLSPETNKPLSFHYPTPYSLVGSR